MFEALRDPLSGLPTQRIQQNQSSFFDGDLPAIQYKYTVIGACIHDVNKCGTGRKS